MALLLFVVLLLVGVCLLSGALAVWLVESGLALSTSLTLLGVGYMVVAMLIYRLSIHDAVVRWRGRMNTIYDVSASIETLSATIISALKRVVERI
mgnify:CR=1 FL=1